ncbi:MAG: RlmE family RNA methyltransferase [Nitrososphaerota archaeon]|nr:RlmE family RNA methyltransferase [Candidatus Calditenuaceae archaeon]MDW8073309.1 RlmE family RNA methyltransferase [Nitrososphaerota archaeon]
MARGRWFSERRADPWHRRAKIEGYPSRAAYKLKHIQRLYSIIRPGDLVVELGAAPGGMLKVVSELVGDDGLAVGVDIKPITLKGENIRTLQIDINDPSAPQEILRTLGDSKCDVLISDASPNLIGVAEVDTLRQLDLVFRCCEIADTVLRDDGNVMLKAFECPELTRIEKPLRLCFIAYRRVTTPPSLRKHSSEVYLLGIGRRRAPIAPLLKSVLE